jgi:hypothetical protein
MSVFQIFWGIVWVVSEPKKEKIETACIVTDTRFPKGFSWTASIPMNNINVLYLI